MAEGEGAITSPSPRLTTGLRLESDGALGFQGLHAYIRSRSRPI